MGCVADRTSAVPPSPLTPGHSRPYAVAYMQAGAWRKDPTTKLAYRSAGAAANEAELAVQDMRHTVQGLAQGREGGVRGRGAMQQGMAQLRQNLVAAARGANTRDMVDQELSKAEQKAADDAKKARMERLTRSTNYKTLAQRREEEEEERRRRARMAKEGAERDEGAFARESRCGRLGTGVDWGRFLATHPPPSPSHATPPCLPDTGPSDAFASTTWRPSSWPAWRSPTRSSTAGARTCVEWDTTRTGTGKCGSWATKPCPTPRPCASAASRPTAVALPRRVVVRPSNPGAMSQPRAGAVRRPRPRTAARSACLRSTPSIVGRRVASVWSMRRIMDTRRAL